MTFKITRGELNDEDMEKILHSFRAASSGTEMSIRSISSLAQQLCAQLRTEGKVTYTKHRVTLDIRRGHNEYLVSAYDRYGSHGEAFDAEMRKAF